MRPASSYREAMETIAKLLALLFAAMLAAGCAVPQPAGPQATFANPVLDSDFPDPAVIRSADGFFYAYATQTERDGRMINMQVARSADLVNWQHLGDALPVKPGWASRTQDFWAPDVFAADGRYYLYYSAKPDAALEDESRGLCLAVATANQPQGPFTDIGAPLLCGEGFVNIDPMAFDDPATGKRLLYWGSGFGPIKVQELAPDRVSFAPGSRPIDLVHTIKTEEPSEYQRLVEGAWVILRGGYYYLFYSGDNCCGPNAHYAAMVARSRSATGPFEIPADKVILEAGSNWLAPGHNSVIRDDAGTDWMLYHAVDTRRPRSKPTDDVNTRRVMLIDPIVWRDGWPRIEGRIPSSGRQSAPIIRRN
ncbi:MAG TPA: glycoside hydrolase family 43 protein [Sphingomicrobium sp.]|jgi:arabinan endo-1,5-alpha-L-arabinosidase|nr:glycoside hydrolase family 43 protein [Sphingomicrobium sp.]